MPTCDFVLCRVIAARDMFLSSCNQNVLQDYLVQRVCHDGSIQCSPALAKSVLPNLLQQLLYALTAPLATPPSNAAEPVGKQETPYYLWRPVTSLVDHVGKADFPNKFAVISSWFQSSLLQVRNAISTEALTRLLISGMHILRRDPDSVIASSLNRITEELCQQANSLPPIAAADSSATREACTRALNDVFDIFHMGTEHSETYLPEEVAHAQGAATIAEKKALLALAMKQVHGEVSVARAAAASRRAHGIADAADEAPTG